MFLAPRHPLTGNRMRVSFVPMVQAWRHRTLAVVVSVVTLAITLACPAVCAPHPTAAPSPEAQVPDMPCHGSSGPSEPDEPPPNGSPCSHCGLAGLAVRGGPQPIALHPLTILEVILPPQPPVVLSIVSHSVEQTCGDSSPPACNPVLRI